jgi:hypothetical protein
MTDDQNFLFNALFQDLLQNIPPIIIQLYGESDLEDDWGSEIFESDSENE